MWDATVFTKNRDRLLDAEVARDFHGERRTNDTHPSTTDPCWSSCDKAWRRAAKFMAAVLAHREVKPLPSSNHFSVDGTRYHPILVALYQEQSYLI